jgi:anti-anti-sigma regulatory factor
MKRAFGDVRLILSGELDRSNLQALDDAFASAESRAKRIVIDLGELTFIDGGGLRALQ